MKTFNIYTKRSSKPVAVKQGWNWSAFFFAQIWVIYHGLAVFLIASFLFVVALYLFVSYAVPDLYNNRVFDATIAFLYIFIVADNGYRIRGDALIKRGYKLSATINAENSKLAILEFKNQSTNEETKEPQESILSKSKDLIKRKIQESASSDKNENSDYVEELKEAKALLDDDLINEEDFEKIKKKIIEDL